MYNNEMRYEYISVEASPRPSIWKIWSQQIVYNNTVNSLLTHTFRWTAQAMGYKGVWVMRAGPKISLEKSWKNREKSGKNNPY